MKNESRKTILLVEDDPNIAQIEDILLKNFGYHVIHANSGEKAVAIFRENPSIHLILMDIDLGQGINGPEAAVMILKERLIPIVFLSSHTEPEIVAKTEQITSYGYVVKNSGITILDASIKMAFRLFEANQKIAASEIKQKAMISNISDVIAIIGRDGIIKYKSPNIEKWFGWKPEDLEGSDCWETVHPEDRERIQKEFFTLLEKENSVKTVEYRYKCKDGSFKIIELNAVNLSNDPAINGVLLNYHDITEKKQIEEFREIVRNANSIILRMDTTGRITYFNEFAQSFFGFTSEEVLGKNVIGTIVPSFDRSGKNLEEMISRISIGVNGYESNENENMRKDGSKVWISWTNKPLKDKNGAVNEVLCIGNDITGRKTADEKIQNLLSEKEIILKEVHHRIKNNMNNIIGILRYYSQSLKDQVTFEKFKEAENSVLSMMLLYDKLYQSSIYHELPAKNYLSSLIDQIIESFPVFRSVKIEKEMEDFILHVKKLQPLGIIINELLSNVMKYAFTGQKDGLIKLTVKLNGNSVLVVIEENGTGVSESIDFEKTVGFGLLLVKKLTKQLEGKISIHREKGTKIILEFEK